MRLAVPVLALTASISSAFAALARRQSLPSCADPCMTNANTGDCPADDDTCLCNNQAFINSTTACIQSACTGNDLANAEAFAQQLCLAVGVTLTATGPSSTGTPSTSAALSSTFSVLAVVVTVLAAVAIL